MKLPVFEVTARVLVVSHNTRNLPTGRARNKATQKVSKATATTTKATIESAAFMLPNPIAQAHAFWASRAAICSALCSFFQRPIGKNHRSMTAENKLVSLMRFIDDSRKL